jgi:hypothetical protein
MTYQTWQPTRGEWPVLHAISKRPLSTRSNHRYNTIVLERMTYQFGVSR